jgi:hypothetical protein
LYPVVQFVADLFNGEYILDLLFLFGSDMNRWWGLGNLFWEWIICRFAKPVRGENIVDFYRIGQLQLERIALLLRDSIGPCYLVI